MKQTHLIALIALAVAGCQTHRGPDLTAKVASRIDSAHSDVAAARQQNTALSGNVSAARSDADRIDSKAMVIRHWLERQP